MADASSIIVPLRVRYVECDPMNVAHHSAYLAWFEMARTEMLREQGIAYRDVEANGQFMAVARLSVRYHRPAQYDDELEVHCRVRPTRGVKLEHRYKVRRGDELLTTAETTLVCLDREGRLQAIPEALAPDH